MADEKFIVTPVTDLVDDGPAIVTKKPGTEADRIDMYRMNKVQELQRIFRLFPMVSFSIILMASWEISLGATVISIYNGGLAGTIYMYLVCWIGFLAVYSSMAEMGSMAPTSGGQVSTIEKHFLDRSLTTAVSLGKPSRNSDCTL